jgi:hypothetical protein
LKASQKVRKILELVPQPTSEVLTKSLQTTIVDFLPDPVAFSYQHDIYPGIQSFMICFRSVVTGVSLRDHGDGLTVSRSSEEMFNVIYEHFAGQTIGTIPAKIQQKITLADDNISRCQEYLDQLGANVLEGEDQLRVCKFNANNIKIARLAPQSETKRQISLRPRP